MSNKIQDEIYKFITDNGIKFFETDKDYQINCISCDDGRNRLGISKKTGAWRCVNGGCGIKGTKFKNLIYSFNKQKKSPVLSKAVTEKPKVEKCNLKFDMHLPFIEIMDDEESTVFNYMIDRGLTEETIDHFEIGCRWEFKGRRGMFDAGDHVAMPYIQDGKCVNLKYRKVDPESKKDKWRREAGGITALFNGDVLKDHDYDWVVIVESEIDCMSFWSLGLKNVVGLTAGADSFKVAWYDQLKRFDKIFIILDNDTAGQDGAKTLAKRLGMGRCYNVVLPEDINDPNDYIQKHSLVDLNKLIDAGKRFAVPKVKSVRELAEQQYHRKFVQVDAKPEPFYKTPWKKINRILGPLRPGYLFILAGKPKSGKTTIAQQLMKYWGNQKIASAIYSCEMRGERLYDKWLMSEDPYSHNIDDMDELCTLRASLKLPLDYMFAFEPTEQEELIIEGVVENAEAMIDRYGLGIMIIDNLHYLCRGENENALISVATQQLKLLAERKDILLIAITHPRKTNSNKQLTTDDMKGSSTIYQDADVVWLMHRLANNGNLLPEEIETGGDGALSPLAEIGCSGRWTEGGKGALAMNGARSLFLDSGRTYRRLIAQLMKKHKKRKKGKGF